ncbi:hypothetical protein Fmac_025500 [Flemingia macrophylla]|uniref:Maturase K n=1 Tax=Flemingia macrophylla TaxID=520843 RepID=A0ABD1LSE1_9FABA
MSGHTCNWLSHFQKYKPSLIPIEDYLLHQMLLEPKVGQASTKESSNLRS